MTVSEIDAKLAPVLIALNTARRARDDLPPGIWRMVPLAIRLPIDGVFAVVEELEGWLGRLKEADKVP